MGLVGGEQSSPPDKLGKLRFRRRYDPFTGDEVAPGLKPAKPTRIFLGSAEGAPWDNSIEAGDALPEKKDG